MRLFWEKGYDATSISELTSAMGIAAPSLYAAFGSKDTLYAQALRHYSARNEAYVWGRFAQAPTARTAVEALLTDSAVALTGSLGDMPRGCMVVLAAPNSASDCTLATTVTGSRQAIFDRLKARFETARDTGEIAAGANLDTLAQFVQTVLAGMSILARDGARGDALLAVARMAMAGFDAQCGDGVPKS